MRQSRFALTAFFMILAVITLAACNFRPKPVTITYYVIDSGKVVTNQIKPLTKPYPYSLILSPVLGALPFRTQKILYRSSEISLSPYLYSRWEYAPTHMLLTKLLTAIDHASIFKSVSFRATGVRGNLYLETTLFDFSHHLDLNAKKSYGVVSAMFQLINGSTRNVIGTKTWIVRKPAPTMDAKGAAQALDAASNTLCLELIQWLNEEMSTLFPQP